MERVAGWYGKIPSLGDFASRRLPRDFIDAWDAWLQESIVASKRILGDRWLDVYLTSPLWRFVLMPGVCAHPAWAGVLMPSVDKTGRHFPLTIALALTEDAAFDPTAALVDSHTWFADLERVALSALDVACLADDLEHGLAQIPFPEVEPRSVSNRLAIDDLALWWTSAGDHPARLQITPKSTLAEMLTAASERIFAHHASGKSIWWSETPGTDVLEIHCFNRLPAYDYFAVMLGDSQYGAEVSIC